MEKRLHDQGVRTAFFTSCSLNADTPIEDLGIALGAAIRRLNVPQVDLVSHSMGGLVVRSYLSGKQSSGAAFAPPADPRVRRWVSIATPHFGALIPAIALPLLPHSQTRQLAPGSRFLFDLATWNQNRDDLRGVEAIALVGNAGGVGPLKGSNDGTVAVTSASLSFALPDERTRVLPYCHGAGDLTSILGLGCDGPPLAKIQTDNPLSWQIIDSFLSGTEAWKTLGQSPRQDPYLSQYGGVLRQSRDRNDLPTGSLNDQPFVTNPPLKGGYTVVIDKPGPQILLAIASAARLSALALAPRMLVSLYGNSLAGSSLTLNGQSLPLNYIADRQINTLLPTGVSGLAKLALTNSQGTQNLNVFMEPAAPAIFTLDGSGTGPAAAIRTADYLSIYLTGLGLETDSPIVLLNGQRLGVTYSGPAPGFSGLDQINVQLPSARASGSLAVAVGRQASNLVQVGVP